VTVLFLLAAGLLCLGLVVGLAGHASIRNGCAKDLGGYDSIDSCESDQSMGVDFIATVLLGAAGAAFVIGIIGMRRRRAVGRSSV
jgi:hypothetical protein